MKTILITGSTDGIGLEAAEALAAQGHRVLVHGRSSGKLDTALARVASAATADEPVGLTADLSDFDAVQQLATEAAGVRSIDVLINNAGVFRTDQPIAPNGLDVRFVVNTIAPYLLTERLRPALAPGARVVNLSSAAQAPVDLDALSGARHLDAQQAYAQSKLALTMWSIERGLAASEPSMIAVNPGSLLATKMVKEGYGIAGHDISIGRDILVGAAVGEAFADASGTYFDNDSGRFAPPHPDALDPRRRLAVIERIDAVLAAQLG